MNERKPAPPGGEEFAIVVGLRQHSLLQDAANHEGHIQTDGASQEPLQHLLLGEVLLVVGLEVQHLSQTMEEAIIKNHVIIMHAHSHVYVCVLREKHGHSQKR